MEVFSVFATLSLVDLLSGPLDRITRAMKGVDGATQGLGQRMGNLALAMGPVALAAGAVLGALGTCVSTAAGFEDQMAKVGAISRASAEDMKALENKARELGATTSFTAVQVGQAEQYLAMAGFSAAENIAALPGVLNLASATATDLGRTADIASDILGAFGMNAAEMGRVADVLAKTCSTANTDMEKLGDTMKYVAPVAKVAGLSIEETAAMAGLLGNVGIKGSQAGTTLKAMLNKMAAPAKEATTLLQKLGITLKDQAGNLKSPVGILGELSGKLKGMGTAQQIAAMKTIVGEEAVAGFAELIEKGGIGKLQDYIKEIQNAGGACDEMAARMGDTLAGDVRGLGSAFESVQITIGKLFIPILRKGAQGVTSFLRLLDKAAQSPIGAFFLQLAAAVSTVVIGVTAFAAAIWGLSSLGGLISRVFLPLKAAILGASAPMLLIIGVIALLYAAFKNNFGGITSTLTQFRDKATLVVKGVLAVFQNLKDGNGEIRGELARQIKANGLVGFVQTVSRIVARVMDVFAGFKKGLADAFTGVKDALWPARVAIADVMRRFSMVFRLFRGDEVTSSRASWQALGETLGRIAGGVLTGLAQAFTAVVTAIGWVARGIGYVIDYASLLCGGLLRLTGVTLSASEAANPTSWSQLGKVLGVVLATVVGVKAATLAWKGVMLVVTGVTKAWAAVQAALNVVLRMNPVGMVITLVMALAAAAGWVLSNWETVKDWWNSFWSGIASWAGEQWNAIVGAITGAWDAIVGGIAGFGASLLDGITAAWDAVLDFFGGLNLFESGAKLLGTFIDGIKSMASSLVDSVVGVFARVREYLPFSDAHVGPLSQLTLSGARMMTTLAEGVGGAQDGLVSRVSGALSAVGGSIRDWWNGLTGGPAMPAAKPEAPTLTTPEIPSMPELTMPPVSVPELPALAPLELRTETLPELPGLELTAPAMPEAPALAAPEIPSMPELKTPEIAIPQAPSFDPPDSARQDGRGTAGGQETTGEARLTVYGGITINGVHNTEDFWSKLQSEISMMEGMA